MTFAEYARLRGVSRVAITKAVQAGRISYIGEGRDRRLDSDVADKEWAETTQHDKLHTPTQRQRKLDEDRTAAEELGQIDPQTGQPKSSAQTYTAARAVKETFNARLARLDFEERSGKLVEAEIVARDAFKTARAVRDSLLSIPDRIAAELAAETNQFRIHARLTEEIKKALVALRDEI